jgi:CRP-like cAMP-binding protein
LLWSALRRVDLASRLTPVELLQSVPFLAALPPPTLEALASKLVPVEVDEGEEIFRAGDPGDRFYVVDDGRVRLTPKEQPARELGDGEYFGEIALLRAVERTATARAETSTRLYALGRDEFVAAVTGHPASAEAADAVIAARLGALRPSLASI